MTVIKIYKPIGKTPLDMIHFIKEKYKHFSNTKMSYAGRLDPMAHGLLIILTEEDCYNQHLYHNLDKTYEFELLLGVSTDTYDILGLVTDKINFNLSLNLQNLIKVVDTFKGRQKQYYPPFSSQRINGKPLWYYAKNNLLDTIILPSKLINIYNLVFIDIKETTKNEILDHVNYSINKLESLNNFRQDQILKLWKKIHEVTYYKLYFKTNVSCGTYIRTLCNDISCKIDIPGIAFNIYRTRVGDHILN